MRRRRPWPWRRTRPSSLYNQKALIAHLQALQTSITGPGVLLRFHSIRKLVESHQSLVTFLVIIGLRDPQRLVCWRALSELSFNGSAQLLRMRIRPAKMECKCWPSTSLPRSSQWAAEEAATETAAARTGQTYPQRGRSLSRRLGQAKQQQPQRRPMRWLPRKHRRIAAPGRCFALAYKIQITSAMPTRHCRCFFGMAW